MKEPFSDSIDEDLFYPAAHHRQCVNQLEIAIRLKRGLNVVIGDAGTGKTTICRQLVSRLSEAKDKAPIGVHLIPTPAFKSPKDFLQTVAKMVGAAPAKTEHQLKESIKSMLFDRGVKEDKLVVLIIDETQKLPHFCLELMRELLNYENNHKLLQIVLFARKDFIPVIKNRPSFEDRINLNWSLAPLGVLDTWRFVNFRVAKAGETESPQAIFTNGGLLALYLFTLGNPGKIMALCRKVLPALVIQNRSRAGWSVVRACAEKIFQGRPAFMRKARLAGAFAAAIALVLFFGAIYHNLGSSERFGADDRSQTVALTPPMRLAGVELPIKAVVPAAEAAGENNSAQTPPKTTYDKSTPAKEKPAAPPEEKKTAPAPTATKGAKKTIRPVSPAPTAKKEAPAETKQQDLTKAEESLAPFIFMPSNKMPDTLGQIIVFKGFSISRATTKIYGTLSEGQFKALAEANPDVKNFAQIPVGEKINFPAVPRALSHGSAYRIRIAQKNTLEDAYKFVKDNADYNLRILPYWNRYNGLVFDVMLNGKYSDEASARRKIQALPPRLAASAWPLNHYASDTVFFSSAR
jgi:general secretion pathway protein A